MTIPADTRCKQIAIHSQMSTQPLVQSSGMAIVRLAVQNRLVQREESGGCGPWKFSMNGAVYTCKKDSGFSVKCSDKQGSRFLDEKQCEILAYDLKLMYLSNLFKESQDKISDFNLDELGQILFDSSEVGMHRVAALQGRHQNTAEAIEVHEQTARGFGDSLVEQFQSLELGFRSLERYVRREAGLPREAWCLLLAADIAEVTKRAEALGVQVPPGFPLLTTEAQFVDFERVMKEAPGAIGLQDASVMLGGLCASLAQPGPEAAARGLSSVYRACKSFVTQVSTASAHSKKLLQFLSSELEKQEISNLESKLGDLRGDEARPQECLASLICFVKKTEMELRRAVLLAGLGQVAANSAEIRRRKAELRSFLAKSSFDCYEEDRLRHLLHEQSQETEREYAEGMARTTEEVEEAKCRAAAQCPTYDPEAEEKDLRVLERLLRSELEDVSRQTHDLECKRQKLRAQQQEGVPEVEEMIRLHKVKERLLQQRMASLETKRKGLVEKGNALCKERLDLDNGIVLTKTKLGARYKELGGLRSALQQALREEARLKKEEKQKVEERWAKLGHEIYNSVGGVMNADGSGKTYSCYDYEARPHKECEEDVQKWQKRDKNEAPPCHYLGAVERGTAFAVHHMRDGNRNIDELSKSIISHLRGDTTIPGQPHCKFMHSTNRHVEDLGKIPHHVNIHFDKISKEIEKDKQNYQNLIDEARKRITGLQEKIDDVKKTIQGTEIDFNKSGRGERQMELKKKHHDKDLRTSTKLAEKATTLLEKSSDRLGRLQDIKQSREQKIKDHTHKVGDQEKKISDQLSRVKESDGPFLQPWELAAARRRFAEEERVLCAVGPAEAVQERQHVEDQLEQLQQEKKKHEQELLHKNEEIKSTLSSTRQAEEAVQAAVLDYQRCIQKRSELSKEAEAKIELCRISIKDLNDAKEKAQSAWHEATLRMLRHNMFEKRTGGDVAAVGLQRVEDAEEIDKAHPLRKRGHPDCQVDPDGKHPEGKHPSCKYGEVLDHVLKCMVEEDADPAKLWEEMQKDDSSQHVQEEHESDLFRDFDLAKKELALHKSGSTALAREYDDKIVAEEAELQRARETLQTQKSLDSFIRICRHDVQGVHCADDQLKDGIDILILQGGDGDWNTVATERGKNSFRLFFEKELLPEMPDQPMSDAIKRALKLLLANYDSADAKDLDLSQPLGTQCPQPVSERALTVLRKALIRRFKKSASSQTTLLQLLEVESSRARLQKLRCDLHDRRRQWEDKKGALVRLEARISHAEKLLKWAKAAESHPGRPLEEQLEFMQSKYGEMRQAYEEQTRHNQELIKIKKAEIAQLKECSRSIKLEEKQIESVVKVLRASSHAFRLGLHIDEARPIHCAEDCPADYAKTLEGLARYVAKLLNNSSISWYASAVPDVHLKAYLNQQAVPPEWEPHLRTACQHLLQELQGEVRFEKEHLKSQQEVLQHKIEELNAEIEMQTEFCKPAAEVRSAAIAKYLTCLQQQVFGSEAPRLQDPLLQEHKREQRLQSFRNQIGLMVKVFEHPELQQALQSLSPTAGDRWHVALHSSLGAFLTLDDSLGIEQLRSQVVSLLQQLLEAEDAEHSEHVLWHFMRKRKLGGEYLLRRMSMQLNAQEPQEPQPRLGVWGAARKGFYRLGQLFTHQPEVKSEDSKADDLWDPWAVHVHILDFERAEKGKNFHAMVSKLEERIAALEAEKKELMGRDTSKQHHAVSCLDLCIRCLDRGAGCAALAQRFQAVEEIKGSVADYLVFEHGGQQKALRFLSSDRAAKVADLLQIENFRDYTKDMGQAIVDLKIQEQSLREEMREVLQSESMDLSRVQLRLGSLGLCLVGNDAFDNGEKLSEIGSLLSLAINSVLGTSSPYMVNGVNQTSQRLEQQTKLLLKDLRKMPAVSDTPDLARRLLELVNAHFAASGAVLRRAALVSQSGTLVMDVPGHDAFEGQDVKLVLFHSNSRFFGVAPLTQVKLHEDDKIDLQFKLSQLAAQIKEEEALFAALCRKRFEEGFGHSLSESIDLCNDYKKELANLKNAKSLLDFNASFCKCLALACRGSWESDLLCLLHRFKSLADQLDSEPQLKLLKDTYRKALLKEVRHEQLRRHREAELQRDTAEEKFLEEQIAGLKEDMEAVREQIASKEDEVEAEERLVEKLLLEKDEAVRKHREKMNALTTTKAKIKADLDSAHQKLNSLHESALAAEEAPMPWLV